MVKKLILPLLLLIFCVGIIRQIAHKPVQTKPTEGEQQKQSFITLTPEEQVGQLFIWGIDDVDQLSTKSADIITKTHPAGILLTGSFTNDKLKNLTDQIQKLPTRVPLFIAIDEEGGTVKHITDDIFDGGRALGMENDDVFCRTIGSRSAMLANAGINVNFGIIADIGWDHPINYIYPRTYGDTPETVTKRVHEAIYCSGNSITVVKHFPGHGGTNKNSHFQIPTIDKDKTVWMQEDGMPFLQAVKDGVDIIMMGHLIYDKIATEPASLSPSIHELLGKTNFGGITITDDLGMLKEAGYDMTTTIKRAITAGNNILLISTTEENPETLYTKILNEATASPILMDEIINRTNKTIELKRRRL